MAQVAPTLWLEGKWQGTGSVIKDGTPVVEYKEMSEFKVLRTSPATIVNLQQFTKHSESGNPLHAENGFIKIFPGESERRVEASYSHPFGMNEFELGQITANTLTLKACEEHHFQRPQVTTETEAKARQVTHVHREYTLTEDGKIDFTMFLGVGGNEPKLHL